MLGVELCPSVVDDVLGLRRETDHEDTARRVVVAQRAQDVDGRNQLEWSCVSAPFLSLLRATLARAPVGDGRGHDQHARARRARRALQHACRRRSRPATTSRPGCRRRVAAAVTSVTRRSLPDRSGGELVAHLAARSIADESHRVDRLASSTRGDHEAETVDGGVRPRRQGAPSPPPRSHPARPSGRCSRGRSPGVRRPGR